MAERVKKRQNFIAILALCLKRMVGNDNTFNQAEYDKFIAYTEAFKDGKYSKDDICSSSNSGSKKKIKDRIDELNITKPEISVKDIESKLNNGGKEIGE